MATARTTALSALIATRRQDAWSDGVLKQYIARDALDRRDAALASQLCYGVLQNRALLEYELSQVLSCKFKDLQPVVADILLLGMPPPSTRRWSSETGLPTAARRGWSTACCARSRGKRAA